MADFGCGQITPECATIYDPCGISREEFICQALELLPLGGLWRRPECNFSQFFCAIAATYYDQFVQICALRSEANPCTADTAIEQWASIWSGVCETLPDDPQALQDVLCAYLSSRGVLTCELITEQLDLLGYDVISCGMDETRSTDLVTPTCGPSLGQGVSLGCYPNTVTDPCEAKFAGIPCAASCCNDDEAPEFVPPDPCDVTANGGYCVSCNSGGSGLGVFQSGPSYYPLENPSCLVVLIDKNSPSIDPCHIPPFGLGLGNSLGVDCLEISAEACAIEALRPAHLQIKYVLDC